MFLDLNILQSEKNHIYYLKQIENCYSFDKLSNMFYLD